MTAPRPSDRHLRPEGMAEYLAAGVPALVPIAGDPSVFLVVDPPLQRVAVRVPWSAGELPDLRAYRHLTAETTVRDGARWAEFAATGDDVLLGAYPVLCAVADRVQQQGMPFALAVRDVLGTYHELLRGLGRLTDQEEVGLFGELFVLDHLIGELQEEDAISAWRGAASEEHDFGFGDDDVEVKTTIAEARRHWVGTVTQLSPTQQRPLWLLSVQLTTAGLGGLTLPELIAGVRHKIVDGGVRHQFEERLADVRWSDSQAALYGRRFRLRTDPAAFLVGASFPAITVSNLSAAGLPVERFAAVSYVIDLSGMDPDVPPPILQSITAGGSQS